MNWKYNFPEKNDVNPRPSQLKLRHEASGKEVLKLLNMCTQSDMLSARRLLHFFKAVFLLKWTLFNASYTFEIKPKFLQTI